MEYRTFFVAHFGGAAEGRTEGESRVPGKERWSQRFMSNGISSSFECLGVSENSGTPKSSILIGFSIINHPFWGTPIFGNTHLEGKDP